MGLGLQKGDRDSPLLPSALSVFDRAVSVMYIKWGIDAWSPSQFIASPRPCSSSAACALWSPSPALLCADRREGQGGSGTACLGTVFLFSFLSSYRPSQALPSLTAAPGSLWSLTFAGLGKTDWKGAAVKTFKEGLGVPKTGQDTWQLLWRGLLCVRVLCCLL